MTFYVSVPLKVITQLVWKSFPDFEIYAYESNPIYLEFLKDNATKNDCGNIKYYGLCDRVELEKYAIRDRRKRSSLYM